MLYLMINNFFETEDLFIMRIIFQNDHHHADKMDFDNDNTISCGYNVLISLQKMILLSRSGLAMNGLTKFS